VSCAKKATEYHSQWKEDAHFGGWFDRLTMTYLFPYPSLNILIKTILAFATLFSMGVPAFALAESYNPHLGETGIIQTPYSMRGRFLFINRISRRTLLQSIIQSQPVWQEKEIV
jgi:hypothetical protein